VATERNSTLRVSEAPFQDCTHPDDHPYRSYNTTPGFKLNLSTLQAKLYAKACSLCYAQRVERLEFPQLLVAVSQTVVEGSLRVDA